MLFLSFNSILKSIQDTDPPLGDEPQLLVYNSGLDAWALLDLNREHDKIAYFEDPRNIAVCIMATSDIRSLGQAFDLDRAEATLSTHISNHISLPHQTPFSAFFQHLRPATTETP